MSFKDNEAIQEAMENEEAAKIDVKEAQKDSNLIEKTAAAVRSGTISCDRDFLRSRIKIH